MSRAGLPARSVNLRCVRPMSSTAVNPDPSQVLLALNQNLINVSNHLIQRFEGLKQHVDQQLELTRLNQGRILAELHAQKRSPLLSDYEFKVFSQWGEDGILQFLTRVIDIPHKTFIEFGVEDFVEANCRFLMTKDHWQGYVIDGSAANIQRLQQAPWFWQHHLTAVDAFITRENINPLLAASGFDHDLGLLSVDIDGNDYHVLEAITGFTPRILVCEYNAVFGPHRTISVPYDPTFRRTDKHHSNLYFGASLAALTQLARRKGYALVGTDSTGCNAFFVRQDLMNDHVRPLSAEQAFHPPSFRQSRDSQGQLNHLSAPQMAEALRGMPVWNTSTQALEAF